MSALDELEQRLKLIRDRVRGVASKQHNGFYLHGRPGTAKTYTVRQCLDEMGTRYVYHSGHLTDMGLFELLDDNSDYVIVLDDVSQLFKQKIALQILLAALGNQRTRKVSYRRKGSETSFSFTGGIIAISNMELSDNTGAVAALKSRVNHLLYNPSDLQLQSLMLEICKKGYGSLSPEECHEVAEFLINQSAEKSARLDMRNLVDKAFPDFVQWKTGMTETHWKDLISSTLDERATNLKHTPQVETRESMQQRERILAASIEANFPDRETRVAHWREQTGKSQDQFYRRMKEAKQFPGDMTHRAGIR